MGNCMRNLPTEYDEVILNMLCGYSITTLQSGKITTKKFKSPKQMSDEFKKLHYNVLTVNTMFGSEMKFLVLFLENIIVNKLNVSLYSHSCADVDKFTDLLNLVVRIGELKIEIHSAVINNAEEWTTTTGNLLLKLSEMKQKNIILSLEFSQLIPQIERDNIQSIQTYIGEQIKFEKRGSNINNGLYITARNDITDASNIKVFMHYS